MGTNNSLNQTNRGLAWASTMIALCALVLLAAWYTPLGRYPLERVRQALAFPYQLDAEEGFVLGQALRLHQGEGLYLAIEEEPYVVDNYPPLYPALWCLALDTNAPSLAAGRWISAIATMAGVLAMFLMIVGQGITWRSLLKNGGGRLPRFFAAGSVLLLAWVTGLIFLTSYGLVRWVGYARVDLLALALAAWGLALFGLWGEKKRWARWGAVLFFGLALLTKQTAVAAPAACFFWLLMRNRKQAFWFAMGMAVMVLGPVLVLCFVTDGRYWLHSVAYNRNVMHWNELALHAHHFARFYAPLLIALGLLVLFVLFDIWKGKGGRETREKSGSSLLLYLLYFVLNALSLISLAKVGSAENYYLEPIFAAALFVGLCGATLISRALRSGFALVALLVLLGLMLVQGYYYSGDGERYRYNANLAFHSAPSPNIEAYLAGDEAVTEVVRRSGPVIAEDPIYQVLAGEPIAFQNFIMTTLAAEGKWDESPVVERLQSGGFSLIIAHRDLMDADAFHNRYSPAVLSAIRSHYRLARHIERPRLEALFFYEPSPTTEAK